jgi:hypothetical protein
VHTPLTQSLATAQALVSAHLAQVPPPQSTSVSRPFFTTSEQLASWQMLVMHTPVLQSAGLVHAEPGLHLGQLPPQSTSDSVPFFTVSLQLAATHLPAVHTLLAQSLAPRQTALVPQRVHATPPQSTSVSVPFFTESKQLGA